MRVYSHLFMNFFSNFDPIVCEILIGLHNTERYLMILEKTG